MQQLIQVPASSPAIVVIVDTIPPDAPIITSPAAGTQNTVITTVSGTAEEGSSVEVFDNGNTIGTAPLTDNTGAWSLTGLSLGDGTHSLTAIATDAATNPST